MGRSHWHVPSARNNYSKHQQHSARTIYKANYWSSGSPSSFHSGKSQSGPRGGPGKAPSSNRHGWRDSAEQTDNKSSKNQHKRRDAPGVTGEASTSNSHKRWDDHRNESPELSNRRKETPEKTDSRKSRHSPEKTDSRKSRHALDKDDSKNSNSSYKEVPQEKGERSRPHHERNLNGPPPWQPHWQRSHYEYHGNYSQNSSHMQSDHRNFNQRPSNYRNYQNNFSNDQEKYWQDTRWNSIGPYQVWFDTESDKQEAHGSNEEKKKEETTGTPEKTMKDENAAPILGSEEERLKNLKETTEWLKERMKNKNPSELNILLKEKSKQKISEAQLKPCRKDAVNLLDSALDASSIEAVKKNLADVLPGDSSLLTSLLTDPGIESLKMETDYPKNTATLLEEKACSLSQSACDDANNTVNSTSILPSRLFETAVKSSPAPNTISPARSTSLKTHQSKVTVSKNDKDKFSRLIRLLTKGQIKDLLTNPRPGKFEYLLKQQVRKHRQESSREIRLSKESSPSTGSISEYLSNERDAQEDCLNVLPICDSFAEGELDTDLVINMNDLPPEFLQELRDALGTGFADDIIPLPEESGTEKLDFVEAEQQTFLPAETSETSLLLYPQQPCTETERALNVPQSDMPADSEPSKRPEIRLRSFARSVTIVSTQQESVAQTSLVVSHKKSSSVNEKISVLSYSGTTQTEQCEVVHSAVEADTTLQPSCPLDGPSLLESLTSTASNTTFPSLTDASPCSSENAVVAKVEVPSPTKDVNPQFATPVWSKPPKKNSAKILHQEVFFSAEDCQQKSKKGKPKKKSPQVQKFPGAAKFVDRSAPGCSRSSTLANLIASRSGSICQPSIPDSTCCEPASERVDPQQTTSTSSIKSSNTTSFCQNDSVEDILLADEDRPKSPPCPQHSPELENELNEAAILSRVQKIIKELAKIKSRESQLIEERSYLYHKLHKVYGKASQAAEPKKPVSKRKSSETGSVNKRPKKLSDSSSTSETATSDSESIASANDKRRGKNATNKTKINKKGASQPSTRFNAASLVQNEPSSTLSKKQKKVLDTSSTSELATSDSESVISATARKTGIYKKTARKGNGPSRTQANESLLMDFRGIIPEAVGPITYKKHSLGFYLNDVSLSGDSFSGHVGIITQVKVIRKLVLVASSVGKVYAFNSSTGAIRKTYGDGKFPVKCFQLDEKKSRSNSETRLYFGTGDGYLHCYALHAGDEVHPPILVSNDIVCIDSKWNFVYLGTKGGSVMRYSIESESLESEPISNDYTSVLDIALSNEGPRKVLIVGCENQPIVLRDASTGLLLRTVTHSWTGRSYKFTLGVNQVFCSSNRDIFAFWYSNGEVVNTYNIPSQVTCLCVSSKVLYVGCADGAIRKFDTETHRPLNVLRGTSNLNVVCMDIVEDKVLVAKRGGVLEVLDNT